MPRDSLPRQSASRSEVVRWRIGYAVLVLLGGLGTWVFGGAWFFAGLCLGYVSCMWVTFADPGKTPTEACPDSDVEDDDAFWIDDRPIIGHCSKCGEAREDDYTCRDGGHTVPLTIKERDGA